MALDTGAGVGFGVAATGVGFAAAATGAGLAEAGVAMLGFAGLELGCSAKSSKLGVGRLAGLAGALGGTGAVGVF